MTCDAFGVSDVRAANKSLCLFYPASFFPLLMWIMCTMFLSEKLQNFKSFSLID